MNDRRSSQSGFSLVELLIALTVTLIVTGAVYGLLTVGQKAFRREPEKSDLQQNLRLAIDVITRDIRNAGVGLSPGAQVFTVGLDAAGPSSGNMGVWDKLDFLADDGTCPMMWATIDGASPEADLTFAQTSFPCYGPNASTPPLLVRVGFPSTTQPSERVGWATIDPPNKRIVFTPGTSPEAVAASQVQSPANLVTANSVTRQQRIRYELAVAPSDNLPSLFRSESGGFATKAVGSYALGQITSPSDGADAIDAGGWELVARGIEDLQVQYRTRPSGGTDSWTDAAPAAVAEDPATDAVQESVAGMVREVRVTLGGRAEGLGAPVEGASNGPTAGTMAIRNRITSSIVPRAILMGMQAMPRPRPPGVPAWEW